MSEAAEDVKPPRPEKPPPPSAMTGDGDTPPARPSKPAPKSSASPPPRPDKPAPSQASQAGGSEPPSPAEDTAPSAAAEEPSPSTQPGSSVYQTVESTVTDAYTDKQGSKEVTLYNVRVDVISNSGVVSHTIAKRFSEFFALMEKLDRMFKNLSIKTGFPPKKMVGSMAQEVVVMRVTALNSWLKKIVGNPNLLYNNLIRSFLNLDALLATSNDTRPADARLARIQGQRQPKRQSAINPEVDPENRTRSILKNAVYPFVTKMVSLEMTETIKQGGFFYKLGPKTEGREEFLFVKVVESNKDGLLIRFGDVPTKDNRPDVTSLPYTLPISAVNGVLLQDAALEYVDKNVKKKAKGMKGLDWLLGFVLTEGAADECQKATDLCGMVALSSEDYRCWTDGFKTLLGRKGGGLETQDAIKKLVEVETELRLLEPGVDWTSVLNTTNPEAPPPPTDFQFCTLD